MTKIYDAYINALLADSAYVNGLKPTQTGIDLEKALTGRMTPDLAKYIGDNFTVVSQIGGLASSFDATVWKSNQSGDIYVSMRGTQENPDFGADVDLASSGLAHQQLADMVNWWLRETTPAGVLKYAAQIVAQPDGTFSAGQSAIATGNLANVTAIKSVNGHSLGGYLASSFVRLFGAKWSVGQTNTFNSAGFSRPASSNIENGFNQIAQLINPSLGLGRFASGSEQNNYFGENGINVTTNTWNSIGFQQYGTRIGMYQEDLTPGVINNHFMYKITDLLALGNVLEQLDPAITIGKLSTMVSAGSNQMISSYEGILDSLRKMLLGANITPTVVGDANADNVGPQPAARLDYQKNIASLQNNATFQSLRGNVQIVTTSLNGFAARDDFGAFLGLYFLTPFALKPLNDAALNALKSAQPTLATQWQIDQNLPASDDKGVRNFSDQWLSDRATLLKGIIAQNNRNDSAITVDRTAQSSTHYRDVATGKDLLIDNTSNTPVESQRRLVTFGKDDAEAITGSVNNDRLYGGGGNDSLDGVAGDDYIEGNAGADTLLGGAGNDQLLGGDGADTFNSGKDSDILKGGAGSDTYQFIAGDGSDTIIDSDGQGVVKIDNITLTGGKKAAAGYWISDDKKYGFALVTNGTGGTDLIISRGSALDQITIRNWQAGQLGIVLSDTPIAPPPTPVNVKNGTAGSDALSAINASSQASVINGFAGNDLLFGGALADVLDGGSENDALSGFDGDDKLDGGLGVDVLMGGYGQDTLNGGAGNDYIFGSGVGEDGHNSGGSPQGVLVASGLRWGVYDQGGNTLYFQGLYPATYANDATNFIDGGAGDDYILTGSGNDVAHGGDNNDLIFGLGSADTLYGDAGDDTVFGDGLHTFDGVFHVDYNLTGADVIDGGAGNDVLNGQGQGDYLTGGLGNDYLRGDDNNLTNTPLDIHGNDYLDGGADNDTLDGGGRDDQLFGGTGADSLYGDGDATIVTGTYQGNDYLDGDDGADLLVGGGKDDELFGGIGNDAMLGDDNTDKLLSQYHGKDYLDGEAGNDTMQGGGNDDQLFGGDDDDQMWGDAGTAGLDASANGSDYLDGEAGNDYLEGGGNDDEIFGGDGNDEMWGDASITQLDASVNGRDYLDGELGNDSLIGGGNSDELFGGDGDDELRGDADVSVVAGANHGADMLNGGAGNDVMIGDGGNDMLFGGDGADALQGDYVSLDGQFHGADTIDGGDGNDSLWGGGGADTLYGSQGDDYLFGDEVLLAAQFHGNDVLYGGDGDDDLYGAGGDDTLIGGAGVDYLDGGAGNDTYRISVADTMPVNLIAESIADSGGVNRIEFTDDIVASDISVTLNGGVGTNVLMSYKGASVVLTNAIAGGFNDLQFSNKSSKSVERLLGENLMQRVTASANSGGRLFGGALNDNLSVSSNAVNVSLSGGRGNDEISLGNNVEGFRLRVEQGDGVDNVGRNFISSNQLVRKANVLDFGAGIAANNVELVWSDAYGALSIQYGVSDKIQLFMGRTGWRDGVRAFDQLQFAGGDTLSWQQLLDKGVSFDMQWNDWNIVGTDVGDRIVGNTFNRSLNGAAGNDTITSGSGAETLIGGAGNDTYLFSATSGTDVVDNQSAIVGEVDELRFDASLASGDAKFLRSGNDLMVRFANAPNQIQVRGFFTNAGTERLVFSDGHIYTRANVPLTPLAMQITEGHDEIFVPVGSGAIDALGGNDTVYGSAGGDTISGGAGNDIVYGNGGNDTLLAEGWDTLYGGAGDDILIGGAGTNILDGGEGKDIFRINRGVSHYSNDEYLPAQFTNDGDLLEFGAGILPSDVEVIRYRSNFEFHVMDSVTKVALTVVRGDGLWLISEARFVSQPATVWTMAQILQMGIAGSDGDDRLYGYGLDDTLDGGKGNDSIAGGYGHDLIFGGEGNDTLEGGNGNDTMDGGIGDDWLCQIDDFWDNLNPYYPQNDVYVFGRGYGSDTVDIKGIARGTNDTIRLNAGVAPSDVSLYRNGDKLVLCINGTQDQISVRGFFDPNIDRKIDQIVFSGSNTTWDLNTILARTISGSPNAMLGTTGNDVFVVDNTLDAITESVNQGTDTIQTSVDYIISANVENLTQTGVLNLEGWGNELANIMRGNSGNNNLNGAAGADTFYGGDGNDYLYGGEGADLINGDAGNDTLGGGDGNDTMIGGAGDDFYADFDRRYDTIIEGANGGIDTLSSEYAMTLPDHFENLNITAYAADARVVGNALNNVIRVGDGWGRATEIDGGLGADTMFGDFEPDTYFVDNLGDKVIEYSGSSAVDVVVSSVSFTLGDNIENLSLTGSNASVGKGNYDNNKIEGNSGNNLLDGSAGNDVLKGNGGNDTLIGGVGDDTYFFNIGDGTDVIDNNAGDFATAIDTIELGVGITPASIVLRRVVDDLVLNSEGNAIKVKDYFSVGGDKKIDRIKFADNTIWNQAAIERNIVVGVQVGTQGADTLTGGVIDETLFGYGGNDTLYGMAGKDTLDGGAGEDLMVGGSGDDTYIVDSMSVYLASDVVVENANEGVDLVQSSVAVLFLADNVENLTITGNADFGGGNALNNVITGNSLRNILDGAGGDDTLIGGDGWDIYRVDSAGDVIVENANEGWDYVESSVTYVLGSNVEGLTLVGGSAINGTGNSLDNSLEGNAAANVLTGGDGDDDLSGWGGADTLIGGDGDDDLSGGDGADTLIGGAGNDRLGGMAGTGDSMVGGDGDDAYWFDLGDGQDQIDNFSSDYLTAIDTVTLGWNITPSNIVLSRVVDDLLIKVSGTDSIVVKGHFASAVDRQIDQIYFNYVDVTWDKAAIAQRAGAQQGGSTAGADNLIGTSANDVIRALAGNDTVSGGAGDDQLFGDADNDTLNGEAGNDLLDGGTGNDSMFGGLGNDTYVVDAVADVITENAAEGTDLVQSSATYTLGANIENLTLTGALAINATGNALNNVLIGNAAANTLNGGAGADTMIGGAGNDTYVVDNAADVITENAAEGTDLVQSSATYTLGANIENLTLTGVLAINATGNTLNNVLTGNAASNVLAGDIGNDTYYVSTGDSVVENSAAGTDTVVSDVTWTLGANLENLTLSGASAINATGNTLNNVLTGNAAANTLNGGVGADTMIGGAGNDTYVVDNIADVVTENLNEGTDLVQSSVAYTLGANIENVTLTGALAINATGNTLNNVLTGNAAVNVLAGGIGNDTYYVSTGDSVVENSAAGTDTVVSDVTWTLGANLENLTLSGASAINATGNTLNNVLTGNSAANTLDGATGADAMIGGAGNDTYVVDNAADTVTENLNEGTDLVKSSVTYTLSANVENLTLTGALAINATGNALNNVLTGNAAANNLSGGAGDDTYVVDNIADVVSENLNEGTDLVQSSVTYALGANVEKLTLTGAAAINGTGNSLDNVFGGNAGANILAGGAGNDIYYVSTGDSVVENANEGTVDIVVSDVTWMLGNNLEELQLVGTNAINATGNALNNRLVGNAAANTLDGGIGADTMLGGAGNDIYVVDNAGDVVTENAAEGIDQVKSSLTYTLGANVEALTLTGSVAINGTGNASDNLLVGNGVNNTLNGATGTDILQGAAGADILTDTSGNNLFDGGSGNDTLTGGIGAEFFAGGTGNDTITTNTGADVIAFNRGDGMDVVNASTGKDNTLSLGKGIKYADLLFKKSVNDLVLVTGVSEQVTLKDWYLSVNNHSIANLQVVIEGTTDYNAASLNKLNNKKVEQFNFDGLATAFDNARAANPALTSWALSSSLLNFYLNSSDTAAIGGDLAYQYAKSGNLSSFSMTPAQGLLANAQFGTANQTLQVVNVLQDLSPRLL